LKLFFLRANVAILKSKPSADTWRETRKMNYIFGPSCTNDLPLTVVFNVTVGYRNRTQSRSCYFQMQKLSNFFVEVCTYVTIFVPHCRIVGFSKYLNNPAPNVYLPCWHRSLSYSFSSRG
jgi:hypothetical protein